MGDPGQTQTTLQAVQEVFRDVFEDDELSVARQTTARDVEDWDSLMHVSLVVAIEQRFGVRFASGDVARLENVGQLVDLVDDHVARKGD